MFQARREIEHKSEIAACELRLEKADEQLRVALLEAEQKWEEVRTLLVNDFTQRRNKAASLLQEKDQQIAAIQAKLKQTTSAQTIEAPTGKATQLETSQKKKTEDNMGGEVDVEVSSEHVRKLQALLRLETAVITNSYLQLLCSFVERKSLLRHSKGREKRN